MTFSVANDVIDGIRSEHTEIKGTCCSGNHIVISGNFRSAYFGEHRSKMKRPQPRAGLTNLADPPTDQFGRFWSAK